MEHTSTQIFPSDVPWGDDFEAVSAFTVAELGEMLPETTEHPVNDDITFLNQHKTGFYDDSSGWQVRYGEVSDTKIVSMRDASEADARATMLIYLIENQLITL